MGKPTLAARNRIGNDVMDLLDPRCQGRRKDDRLLGRILLPEERAWVDEVTSESAWAVRLWALWAAKESAFKVYCKLVGDGTFRPRSFLCRLEAEARPDDPSITRIRGEVEAADPGLSVTIEGSSNQSYVHLVGWAGSGSRPRRSRMESGLEELGDSHTALEALRDRFTPEEWEGIHSLRSAHARLLARERVRSHLGLGAGADGGDISGRVEIRTTGNRSGKLAPQIWFGGTRIRDLDLSLSHHGRFVAWALLVPQGR
jgi:phosphopantetheinyl transferase (holo-ACP synthase)